ncbi:MAG: permease [Calditrichia bacterium]
MKFGFCLWKWQLRICCSDFWVAGLLNSFLTREQVAKHLSERRFSPIWKRVTLGIPLSLCSCGVIPVAAHLDKQGANRGATLSFLIYAHNRCRFDFGNIWIIALVAHHCSTG